MIRLKHVEIILVAFFLLLGCNNYSESITSDLPPQSVSIYKLTMQNEPSFEEVLGTIRTGLKSTIEAKINGRIERIYVTAGSLVNSGQIMAELDVKEVRARLEQALAVREQTTRELKRYSTLIGRQAIPQQEFDSAQTRLRIAEASVTEAQTMLGYSQISAPFDGIITKKVADIGDLAAPGKPLFELEDPSALEVHTNIPEGLMQFVSIGQNLTATTGPLEISGKITEISPVADINSRTFLVKFQIPPTPGIRSGQLARTKINVGNRDVLIVPLQALIKKGQMEIVFVAENNLAKMRIVKSGRIISNQIEILSGLHVNDDVIVRNADKLFDLRPIKID